MSPCDPPTWEPLLDGDLALRARCFLDEIAAALDGPTTFADAPFTLHDGLAGYALFRAYHGFSRGEERELDRAVEILERAIQEAGGAPPHRGIMNGVAGVAWTVEHLGGRLFGRPSEDPHEGVDALLAAMLDFAERHPDQHEEFDLMFGLAGMGLYALERPGRSSSRRLLERIVVRLHAAAHRREDGFAWHTPFSRLDAGLREEYPNGFYNMGVAHGTPGIVGFLARVLAAGAASPLAEDLLRGALVWIRRHAASGRCGPSFPNRIKADDPDEFVPARVGWCYGNLGIAPCLFAAARETRDDDLERYAKSVADEAAARPAEECRVIDAGLCHGAAGVAHLFNRLYQATGEGRYRRAAIEWYERTIDLRFPWGVAGVTSYRALTPDVAAEQHPSAGFLTGAAGVGLALCAAISHVEPAWDRLLLASIPPVRVAA